MYKNFFAILLLGLLSGCSQFSNSFTSKVWHNTNTKYNALLLSEDFLDRAEYLFDSTRAEDYSQTLPVFHPIDTVETAIASAELDEIIKLTSLIAERHSNSRFLDRSYVLLGIARFYKGDFLNANEVFKYVNTNGTKEADKHAALLWLMRSFLETKDYRDANDVAKILQKENLNPENRAYFFELNAAYHQKLNEIPLSVAFLDESIQLLKKSKHKARLLFIAGQMYQELERTTDARKKWLKVVKNKPDYNLEFNTQIELLMTNSLYGSNANFEKMLEDRKNQDLKDKIYFKKAEANFRKEKYEAAVRDFKKSASLAKDRTSKAAAFLQIAEISYQNLSNYFAANNYYDSTLSNLSPSNINYNDIKEKAQSLSSYILYSKVIQTEDSLQALAALNPLELERRVEKILEAEAAKTKILNAKAAKLADKKAQQAKNIAVVTGKTWFMYNQIALSKARNAFIKEWGNRPLEDNWRRKDKEAGQIKITIEKGNEVDQEQKKIAEAEAKAKATQLEFERKKRALISGVPNDPRSLAQSKRKQEEAYYQLGKIYKLQFEEADKAEEMFQTLLRKFPNTVYEQEVLYFLALMNQNPANNPYKTKLLKEHPFSSYARQLKKGNVEVTADTESRAAIVYEEFYTSFHKGEYETTLAKVEKALLDYTGTSIEDKFALLRILLLAKTGNLNLYRIAILDFKQSYPSSKLSPLVNEMLLKLEKSK